MYNDTDDKRLYEFLRQPNSCLLEEAEDTLRSSHKHFALALLYRHHGLHDKALAAWTRLLTKEITPDNDDVSQ